MSVPTTDAADVMARLMEMMGETTPKKAAKPRIAAGTAQPAKPTPAVVQEDEDEDEEVVAAPAAATDGDCPVVVLDDGQTFSNLANCRVCFVSPTATEVTADDLDRGVSIADLLTLRDALLAIRKIVG